MTNPKPLSPAAQAVLQAVTQREYSLDPEDIPNEASRLSSYIATALGTAAKCQMLGPEHWQGTSPNDWELGWNASMAGILAIADELEGHGHAV